MHRHAIFFLIFLMPLRTLASMDPNALELLERYAETQDKCRSFIIKSEDFILVNGRAYGGRMVASNEKTYLLDEIRFDGEKFNRRTKRWSDCDRVTGPISKEPPHYQSTLWDGKTFSRYGKNPKSGHRRLYIEKTPDKIDIKMAMIISASGSPCLMGYFYGDNDRIDSVIRKAYTVSLREKQEKIADSSCFVIDAVTLDGKYTLWIDPNHGYNIAKAIVRKKNTTAYGIKQSKVESALNSCENIRFEKIDNVWVPIEADIVMNIQWPKGEYSKSKIHHKRTEAVLNPDHEALGSFVLDDVENDTEVLIIDNSTISKFTWSDGQVVDEKGNVIMDCRPKKQRKK